MQPLQTDIPYKAEDLVKAGKIVYYAKEFERALANEDGYGGKFAATIIYARDIRMQQEAQKKIDDERAAANGKMRKSTGQY